MDGGASLPDRACVVTFDDGLRCQLEHALPVLDRLGVPATFFVPGLPLSERRALPVHKLHHVRERLEDDELTAELERAGISVRVDDEKALEHYRYDTAEAARIKYLLNVSLPVDERERAIDRAFERVHGDEEGFCGELYMSGTEVAGLERSRHAVGAHSYAHRPLAQLSPQERRRDLECSVAVLEPLIGSHPRALSYPYGVAGTVDADSARDVEAAGFQAAFTMERTLNRTLVEPCLLARFDANDAPGGLRPLLDVEGDRPVLREREAAARAAYVHESAEGGGC